MRRSHLYLQYKYLSRGVARRGWGSGITGQVLRNRVEGDGWILRMSNCPPRFWQFSKPYLNQRGQIVPPTLIFAHSALGSFHAPD